MELTKEEKSLLTLYKKFYGVQFDCLNTNLYDSFQNMYCVLQTIPENFGGKVMPVNDFKVINSKEVEVNPREKVRKGGKVFSKTVSSKIALLAAKSSEVEVFYKNTKIDGYLPVAIASTSPDIDLSVDQGIAPYNDFNLMARVCLFISRGHNSVDEVKAFVEKETYREEYAIKGDRNIYLTDYIISLLGGYGLISSNKDNSQVYVVLTPAEKEVLRSYYSFYRCQYDPKASISEENTMNAIAILQSVGETSGCYLDNKYAFTASSKDNKVSSDELKTVLKSIKEKAEEGAITGFKTDKMAPIAVVLREENFDTIEKLGRFANACVYAKANPSLKSQDILNYLNNLDAIDIDFSPFGYSFNKKVVILLERFGLVERSIEETNYQKRENKPKSGFVRKLAKIFGGQK